MNTPPFSLKKRLWWEYLEEDLQELLRQSQFLVAIVEKWRQDLPSGRTPLKAKPTERRQEFHDYAFIVFPAAKAYEGFLKTLFLDLGFITSKDYYGKRFRVGKALNPALDARYRKKESVYDRLIEFCQGRKLADKLWETWKSCRNLLFHWFPNEKNVISFAEAKEKVLMVLDAMDLAFKECKISREDTR